MSRVTSGGERFWKTILLVTIAGMVALGGPWSPLASDAARGRGGDVLEADESKMAVELVLDRQVYNVGEPLALALVGINQSDAPIELRFASGKQYDFVITREGEDEPLVRWSTGRFFTMMIRNREVEPGEPLIFSVKWTPQADGASLPAGEYEIRGALAVERQLSSEPIAFEIR